MDGNDNCTAVNIFKPIDLYPLNGYIVQYVNYASIKAGFFFFKEENTKKAKELEEGRGSHPDLTCQYLYPRLNSWRPKAM